MNEPILYTFPPSLDCEFSRFLLAHYGIRHTERRHTFLFVTAVTLWRGFTPLFPLLVSSAYRLDTVRKMVDTLDPTMAKDRQLLLPAPHRDTIEADWDLFNGTLGYAAARFAYYHLLPHRDIMIRPLSEGAPPFEQSAVRMAYPLFAGLLRLALWLTKERADSSLAQAREIFSTVETRLADGRRYLVGDHFSLSDIAFAVAAGPFVLPDNYGGPIPTLAEMPPVVKDAVIELRARRAGQYAMQMYREFRDGQGGATAASIR